MNAARAALIAIALCIATVATGAPPMSAGEADPAPPAEPEPEPYLEQFPDGYVDWGEGVVAAWGKAINREDAHGGAAGGQVRYAAELNAKARLLAIVQNLRADAEFRIGDRPDVVEKVSGIVRGAKVIRDRQGKGRFHEVLMVAPLHGVEGLSYQIYEMSIPSAGSPAPDPGGEPGTAAAPAAGPASAPREGEGEPTGIVIDARGTGLRPALLPRIVDPSGEVVSAPATVNQEDLKDRGMAAYAVVPGSVSEWRDRIGDSPLWVRAESAGAAPAPDLRPEIGIRWVAFTPENPHARRIPSQPERVPLKPGQPRAPEPAVDNFPERKGPRPYRLKASDAGGTLKADIVLSKADADRIEADPAAVKRLKECRVLVIVESPLGGVEGVRLRPPARRAWPPGA